MDALRIEVYKGLVDVSNNTWTRQGDAMSFGYVEPGEIFEYWYYLYGSLGYVGSQFGPGPWEIVFSWPNTATNGVKKRSKVEEVAVIPYPKALQISAGTFEFWVDIGDGLVLKGRCGQLVPDANVSLEYWYVGDGELPRPKDGEKWYLLRTGEGDMSAGELEDYLRASPTASVDGQLFQITETLVTF